MTIQSKIKKLGVLALHPEILLGKKKFLFVVSHMRSRSSVLCHILGSNPEVCGYKELHQSYKGKRSLVNMQIALAKDLRCNLRNKYLLDKLLNNFTISDEILHKVEPNFLFLLREPEETLKSIIHMGIKTGEAKYKDPLKCVEYYCKRLSQLEILAHRAGERSLFIESNNLIENPESTLNKIGVWLNLKQPLETNYRTFRDTGIIGFGDPLENIKLGVLKATDGYDHIHIPNDLLNKANESYEKCRVTLMNKINY